MERSFLFSPKSLSILLFLFLLDTCLVVGQELYKLPAPTHSEKGLPCSSLVLVKEINSSYDDDVILARPIALTVDASGNIFVYDSMLKRISKFDKNFKYITNFMKGGRGPGESGGGGGMEMGFYKIYYAPDSNIYVSDPLNNKIIIFSTAGVHLKDIRLDRSGRVPFCPVVDRRGHLYALNGKGKIIDELDINSKMKLICTYLDDSLNNNFIIFKPKLSSRIPKQIAEIFFSRSDLFMNYYDVTRDNQLLLFLANSSTLYVFKGMKLVFQTNVFIHSEMEKMQNEAVALIKRAKKSKGGALSYSNMFKSFFIDKDDDRFFYLCTSFDMLNLYKFSVRGVLVKTLSYPEKHLLIVTKRNNLFYGFSGENGNPVIFKEENKK